MGLRPSGQGSTRLFASRNLFQDESRLTGKPLIIQRASVWPASFWPGYTGRAERVRHEQKPSERFPGVSQNFVSSRKRDRGLPGAALSGESGSVPERIGQGPCTPPFRMSPRPSARPEPGGFATRNYRPLPLGGHVAGSPSAAARTTPVSSVQKACPWLPSLVGGTATAV